jgi:glycine betaine/proline transport system ATP-binding protein
MTTLAAACLIRAEHLAKVYGHHPERALALLDQGRDKQDILAATRCTIAVRDVSFEILRGELFVIMGLSGSGKSTVIRLLNGLITPTRGSVSVDGKNIHTLPRRELREVRNRSLGMVFQHFALFPHRTVRDNVAYGLHVRRVALDERRARTDAMLKQVGLAGWGEAYPGELSGGMKQRVGLARALATDAEVLIMDEPFSALDPLIRREMQDLLLSLHRDLGRTIVFVTHDLNEAMRIGQRIMIMRDGGVAQLGTGAQLLSLPADDYVARFVAEVDRARVLTAADVMRGPAATAELGDELSGILGRTAAPPATAVYVLDRGHLAGVASAAALRGARERGQRTLDRSLIEAAGHAVDPGATVAELCAQPLDSSFPLAVIDAAGRVCGTVTHADLLAAVGGRSIGP